MKASYKIRDGKVTFEVEGDTTAELFEQLAQIEEVFAESACGRCKKSNLQFRVRIVDGNKFFELLCKDCRGTLTYGQNKKGGGLFPHRKIGEGENAVFDREYRGWREPWKPQQDNGKTNDKPSKQTIKK